MADQGDEGDEGDAGSEGIDVTRIVAGQAGGRRLVVPRGDATRPTTDRVREALFSALAHDPGLEGAAVLDLCAGSGALGLEALSRGAEHVLLVESDKRAVAVLRRNITAVGLPGAHVRQAPVAAVLGTPADRPYDVLLADPPYAMADEEVTGWLAAALANGWLAPDATVVVERPARGGPFPWPEAMEATRERRYGETALHVARCYGRPP